jgi:hypothetical protein
MFRQNFIIIFLVSVLVFPAQNLRLPLSNIQTIQLNDTFFVAGMQQTTNGLQFKLYKINKELSILDSTSFNLKSVKLDQLLPINADTLHGTFNYSIQKKESKNKVSLLRFNKQLKLVFQAEQIDVARVNSFTNFKQDRYVYQSHLFIAQSILDASGTKQFFLTNYQLKTPNQAFEYDVKWQFALDRKFIQTVHIIYADSNQVMLFVNVSEGVKKGQWVLRVNAKNGFLIRGTHLNSKTEEATYQFSDYYLDKKTKAIILSGQRLDDRLKTPALTANKVEIFLLKLDSMGNIESRSSQLINLQLVKIGKTNLKTELKNYRIQMRFLAKQKNEDLQWQLNIYQQTATAWQYMDSHVLTASALGDDFTFDTKALLLYQNMSLFFWSTDKLNTNGQLVADSINGNDGIFFNKRELSFLNTVHFGDFNSKIIIVQKPDVKKQTRVLQAFRFDGKIMTSNLLKEMPIVQTFQLVSNVTHYFLINEEEGVCTILKAGFEK